MAVYQVVNTVQCADRAEYDLLIAHLDRRGIREGDPPPPPWDRASFDLANLRVTLGRRDTVDGGQWS